MPSTHVLVLGPLPPPVHGAARVTQGMADWLMGQGVQVEVIDTSAHGTRSRGGYAAARICAHLRATRRLFRRPDAAYVGGAGGYGLYLQLLCVAVARALDVPVVFHHHSSAYLDRRTLSMRVICALLKSDSTHLVLSADMETRLRTLYSVRAQVRSVGNAAFVPPIHVDVPPARRTDGHSTPVRLGHLSNLSIAKGIEEIVQVAERLDADAFDYELHVAGPVGSDAATAVETLRSNPRVTVIGPLTPDQVGAYYGDIDIMLFPSHSEASPLVIIEAAGCAVPTVAHAIGGIPELIDDPALLAPRGGFVDAAVHAVRAWHQDASGMRDLAYATYVRLRHDADVDLDRAWSTTLQEALT